MQIAEKKVVKIEYTLKNDAGEVLDTSDGGEPLAYVHGVGGLIPGLEKALDGKSAGDTLQVSLTPADGYGERDEELIQNIPLRKLPDKKVKVGARYRVQTPEGPRVILVTAVKGDYATIDANHPLAGMTLHFQVKVLEVRDATAEELEHGHSHGPGGHHEHDDEDEDEGEGQG